ncbi:hypothetical protein Tco_1082956 [Tanacetum coccineum]|uniref:Uncharacterized protein n=1 Tax=Tanacetum coccineum TaxID=301880 RepID=A0ABQ5I1W1_9ASTR
MVEPTLKEFVEKAQTESNLSNNGLDVKLSKEFLMELKSNPYHGMFDEDMVVHIAKVLEILNLIKIPNVDTDRLRTKVFPLSLANDAKQWRIDEWDGKTTAWGILVGRFFCKYFLISCDGMNYVASNNNADESGYRELMAWLRSKKDDERIDRMTKSSLCHSWIYEWGNNKSTKDTMSSDEEWEESKGNPPDTTTDSFFNPYLTQENNNIEKDDEQSLMKRKCSNSNLEDDILNNAPNSNDERPNKKMCKAEKFEAIKYSLRPNEEYIAVRRCEYNAWKKNKECISQIYQEIFQKKDNGWKVSIRRPRCKKKLTKLVKYQSSGILCVIVVMLIILDLYKSFAILRFINREKSPVYPLTYALLLSDTSKHMEYRDDQDPLGKPVDFVSRRILFVLSVSNKGSDFVPPLDCGDDVVRVISYSFSGVAPYNDATLEDLQTKHAFKPAPSLSHIHVDNHHLISSSNVVLYMIKSFPHGTSCRRDELCAQRLMDCLSGVGVAIYDELVSSITQIVNLFLDGNVPRYWVNILLVPLSRRWSSRVVVFV